MAVTATRKTVSWPRKAFHAVSLSSVAVVTILSGLGRSACAHVAAAVALVGIVIEVARLWSPRLNARILRTAPTLFRRHEKRQTTSATWFLVGAVLTSLVADARIAGLSFLYLALGDPVASWVGVRYGRTKLPGGKSLEGSLSFLLVCLLVGIAFFIGVGHATFQDAASVAGGGALAGAVAEWAPVPVDDNCRVPPVAAATMSLIVAALAGGVPT